MTTYMSRSKWTASKTLKAATHGLDGEQLKGVEFVTPGRNEALIGVENESKTAARLRGYRNYHLSHSGYDDIGYNFAIDQAGRVWMLRSTSWRGNRGAGRSDDYVRVLLVLGDEEIPSASMHEAVNDWYSEKFREGWRGKSEIHDPTFVLRSFDHLYDEPDVSRETEPPPEPPVAVDDYPGRNAFRLGRRHDAVKRLAERLVEHGFTHHHDGHGFKPSTTFTEFTRGNVADFQFMQGRMGNSADGFPDQGTWDALMGDPNPPTLDLATVQQAARKNPWTRSDHIEYEPLRYIEFALVRMGHLHTRFALGDFSVKALYAYRKWQRTLGFRGNEANGVPDAVSLRELGERFGFRVEE